jgi:hypothetical protein
MSSPFGVIKARFSGTGVGTNAGVTVTQNAPTRPADYYLVTSIDCSGDAAALVTVESPASTVIWRKRFAAAFNAQKEWPDGLVAAAGQAVLVKISASTANCEANISGVRR